MLTRAVRATLVVARIVGATLVVARIVRSTTRVAPTRNDHIPFHIELFFSHAKN